VAAGRERRRSRGQATRARRLRGAEEESGSRCCLCTSPFHPRGSRCDQDSPINPALVILFCFPPPSHFSLAESRLCFGPFFCSGSCSPGLEPVARCSPLPSTQLPSPVVSFAAVGSTTQTTSVTKLVLTGRSPVPEPTARGLAAGLRGDLAAGGSRTLPEQPLARWLPPPQSTRQCLALGTGLPQGLPSPRYRHCPRPGPGGATAAPSPGRQTPAGGHSVPPGPAAAGRGLVSRAWGQAPRRWLPKAPGLPAPWQGLAVPRVGHRCAASPARLGHGGDQPWCCRHALTPAAWGGGTWGWQLRQGPGTVPKATFVGLGWSPKPAWLGWDDS